MSTADPFARVIAALEGHGVRFRYYGTDQVRAHCPAHADARPSLVVTRSYLARICECLNVPRPPRGHWGKLRVGKAVKKPELPTAMAGDETSWTPGQALDSYALRRVRTLRPPQTSSRRQRSIRCCVR
jgi:hypothetical protein